MLEVLILFHGNGFLINKNKIRLLYTENLALTEEIQIFIS